MPTYEFLPKCVRLCANVYCSTKPTVRVTGGGVSRSDAYVDSLSASVVGDFLVSSEVLDGALSQFKGTWSKDCDSKRLRNLRCWEM